MNQSPLISDPKVECWDYCFDKMGHSDVWFGRAKVDDDRAVFTETTPSRWRYLIVADTKEQLIEDIVNTFKDYDEPVAAEDIIPVQTQVHAILNWWRMIRYNGHRVCAMQTKDFYPSSAYAWPFGPIAPIRNAFIFAAKRKENNEYLGITLDKKDLPVCANSVGDLIEQAGQAGVEAQELFDEFDLVARNVLDFAIEYPIIIWNGMPFPLLPVLHLNPNHNGDPEEDLLAS